MRIAPDEISFSSPAAARDIFAIGKGFNKTDFYFVFPQAGNPDIFTEIREWKHAQIKRFAVVPYSMASVQKMAPFVDDVERLLMEKLDGYAADPGKACDLGDWLHYFAFDVSVGALPHLMLVLLTRCNKQVLGETVFSHRLGFVSTGTDVDGLIRLIDDVQWYDGIIGSIPEWDKVFRQNPLLPYIPFLAPKPILAGVMAFEEMRKRKEGDVYPSDRRDVLGQLVEAHMKKPDEFTESNVHAVAFGAM